VIEAANPNPSEIAGADGGVVNADSSRFERFSLTGCAKLHALGYDVIASANLFATRSHVPLFFPYVGRERIAMVQKGCSALSKN
jgi:hypothetical protein